MPEFNMTAIPIGLADRLNIPTFAGQLLAVAILLMITIFPVVMLRKNRGGLAELIIGLIDLGFCIVIGWLPTYFLVLLLLLIAGIYSRRITRSLT